MEPSGTVTPPESWEQLEQLKINEEDGSASADGMRQQAEGDGPAADLEHEVPAQKAEASPVPAVDAAESCDIALRQALGSDSRSLGERLNARGTRRFDHAVSSALASRIRFGNNRGLDQGPLPALKARGPPAPCSRRGSAWVGAPPCRAPTRQRACRPPAARPAVLQLEEMVEKFVKDTEDREDETLEFPPNGSNYQVRCRVPHGRPAGRRATALVPPRGRAAGGAGGRCRARPAEARGAAAAAQGRAPGRRWPGADVAAAPARPARPSAAHPYHGPPTRPRAHAPRRPRRISPTFFFPSAC